MTPEIGFEMTSKLPGPRVGVHRQSVPLENRFVLRVCKGRV